MHISDLIEANIKSRTIEITDVNSIDAFIKHKCPIAYTSILKIYRGIENKTKPLLYGDSRDFVRKSRNNKNYYMILMNTILPSWSKYPDRQRSFICATTISNAISYGNVYRVYPVGNPIIAICPTHDIVDNSFKELLGDGSVESIDIMFRNIQRYLRLPISDEISDVVSTVDIINSFFKQEHKYILSLTEIDDWFKTKTYHILELIIHELQSTKFNFIFGLSLSEIKKFVIRFQKVTDFLELLLNPTKNNFRLIKLSEITTLPRNNEIWFSGPAYFRTIDAKRYT